MADYYCYIACVMQHDTDDTITVIHGPFPCIVKHGILCMPAAVLHAIELMTYYACIFQISPINATCTVTIHLLYAYMATSASRDK